MANPTIWRPPAFDLLGAFNQAADPLRAAPSFARAGSDLMGRTAGMLAGAGSTVASRFFAPPGSNYGSPPAEIGATFAGPEGGAGAPGAGPWHSPASLAGSAASIGFGIAGDKLLDSMGHRNLGSRIGSGVGGAAGSLLGPPGALVGSVIGGTIGGAFGPGPSVGPNGQAWLGRDPSGRLSVTGSSGDNGIDPDYFRNTLSAPVGMLNSALMLSGSRLKDLPATQLFSNMNMSPTLQFGRDDENPYLAPYLGPESIARALVKRGYVDGNADDFLSRFGGPGEDHVLSVGDGWYPMSQLPTGYADHVQDIDGFKQIAWNWRNPEPYYDLGSTMGGG